MEKIKYSSLVLLGGVSYGLLSTVIKLGFAEGFTIGQLVGGQHVMGWAGLFLLLLFMKKGKVSAKQVFVLLAVGGAMSLTSILYGYAVQELTASIAVVCLFQFTWIGVLIEAVANKKFPSADKWFAILILFIGTFLAGGVFEGTLKQFSWLGIMFGIMAAFSFAFYIFASGRIETAMPPVMKSFIMATGALITVSLVFRPDFVVDGSIPDGLWKYAIFLGLFGMVIPNLCYSIGTPKVGTGLGTILGAFELPTVIIASVLLLDEHVSLLQWAGIAGIIIGIIIPQYRYMRDPSPNTKSTHPSS